LFLKNVDHPVDQEGEIKDAIKSNSL